VYYSPSIGKTYLGKLPADVEGKGEYGVGVRSFAASHGERTRGLDFCESLFWASQPKQAAKT
jgi:hypothetical protein